MSETLFVIGSVNADLSITTSKFPQKGETITGQNFQLTMGGKGANQAFYASQFGIPTMMFCSLGKDYFGQYVLDELGKTSIILKPQFSQTPTGKAFVFISEGDNRIILEPGANYDIDLNTVQKEIEQSQAKYLLSQLEVPFEIVLKSFQFGKTKQTTTILNPAPANITDEIIYKSLDYLILNETEAEALTKLTIRLGEEQSYAQICDYFLKLGVQNVILTLGEIGSYFQNKTTKHFEPALKVNVVNTTGAGDAYLGAFISQVMQGKAIPEAMKFATKIAGHVCEESATQVVFKGEK